MIHRFQDTVTLFKIPPNYVFTPKDSKHLTKITWELFYVKVMSVTSEYSKHKNSRSVVPHSQELLPVAKILYLMSLYQ